MIAKKNSEPFVALSLMPKALHAKPKKQQPTHVPPERKLTHSPSWPKFKQRSTNSFCAWQQRNRPEIKLNATQLLLERALQIRPIRTVHRANFLLPLPHESLHKWPPIRRDVPLNENVMQQHAHNSKQTKRMQFVGVDRILESLNLTSRLADLLSIDRALLRALTHLRLADLQLLLPNTRAHH